MTMMQTERRGELLCASCGNYFPASARRIRMVLAGEASRYCKFCRSLGLTRDRNVLPEHKAFWRNKIRDGDVTARGELVTQEWIDDVAEGIWG